MIELFKTPCPARQCRKRHSEVASRDLGACDKIPCPRASAGSRPPAAIPDGHGAPLPGQVLKVTQVPPAGAERHFTTQQTFLDS